MLIRVDERGCGKSFEEKHRSLIIGCFFGFKIKGDPFCEPEIEMSA
jgi:hypothetical protein